MITNLRRILWWAEAALGVALAGWIVGCAVQGKESRTIAHLREPDIAGVAREFTNYVAVSKERALVNPDLAYLCVGVTPKRLDMERVQHGPHANAAITVFMNPLAAAAFAATNVPYPVGSVVVKQKQVGGHWEDFPGGRRVHPTDGVGGMVKRAPGYDPEHGDWEYFYFEEPAKIEQGKIQSCVRCHVGAKATDHVFGTWERASR